MPADEMVKGIYRRDLEPNGRFASELTRATNQKQMQNVLECLTSVEQRLRHGRDGRGRPGHLRVAVPVHVLARSGARTEDGARDQRESRRDRAEAPAALRRA